MSTNGLLSFGSSYNGFSNEEFPGSAFISSLYLVAPYWDDVDISRDEIGQISYEIHESGSYYLNLVNDFLLRQRPSTFSATWMFVAYWDSVRPYPGSSSTEVSETCVQTHLGLVIANFLSLYSRFLFYCVMMVVLFHTHRKIHFKPFSLLMVLIPMPYSPMTAARWSGIMMSPLATVLLVIHTITMILRHRILLA